MPKVSRPASTRPLGDGDVGLWVPFKSRELAKALPGARWDKHLEGWRVPAEFAHEAQRLVANLNGGSDAALVDALTVILTRLPDNLRNGTHQCLFKVWLEDDRARTSLSQAWERVVGS